MQGLLLHHNVTTADCRTKSAGNFFVPTFLHQKYMAGTEKSLADLEQAVLVFHNGTTTLTWYFRYSFRITNILALKVKKF